MITQKHLKKVLSYNSDTGVFTWLVSNSPRVKVGSRAGHINSLGYTIIGINNKLYNAHRIAWLYEYGEFPQKHIDHINGDRSDNSIDNLRDVSQHSNSKNGRISKNNTSGHNGVYKQLNSYIAKIKVLGKSLHIGSFKDKEDAIKARQEANIKYGFHENHGK